ncbi:MAG: hypothetical protein MUF23_11155 [Pirellula sp.]|nr:hypothetical protein [Pirellula sp.]
MNVRTVELGCERGWRRGQWRTELAIPKSAPCLGILGAMHPKQLESILRPLAQELRWAIPGIRIGILVASHSGASLSHSSGQRSSEPFQIRSIATNAIQVLDWICGVDVWLNLGDGPLTNAIERIASDIRLPVRTHSSTNALASQSDSFSLAQGLVKQFQLADAQFAMLAFPSGVESARTSKKPMTVDEAISLLQDSLCATVQTWVSETDHDESVSVRPAA